MTISGSAYQQRATDNFLKTLHSLVNQQSIVTTELPKSEKSIEEIVSFLKDRSIGSEKKYDSNTHIIQRYRR